MGDTLNETPPTRRDKPQSLNISQDEQESVSDSANLATRSPRTRELERDRDREREREREHSCDGLSTSSRRSNEFVGLVTPPRRESLNSCEPQRQQTQLHSPSAGGLSSSLNKALGVSNRGTSAAPAGGAASSRYSSSVVVGGGIGNLAGTTTRKCVLTLDGYSYVIVASTPETLPSKRDESNIGAGGSGSSSSAVNSSSGSNNNNSSSATAAAGSATLGEATAPDNGTQSPTSCDLGNATINGQVAKHGSLTIVRRSNSRKNFTQIDGQTQSTVASPSSASISFFQAPLSEPLAERLSGRSTNGASSLSAADKRVADKRIESTSTSSATTTSTTIIGKSSVGRMQPSSPNQTNFVTDLIARSSAHTENTLSQEINFSQSDNFGSVKSSSHSMESESNQSADGQWGTDNLPTVETAEALNKAAIRIRSLLRRMDQETVAYEDMQRNLHYAARVLEAVFIDESRSPTTGKSKLGQIASSSVESEDGRGKQRCNGNCKNLNNNNTNSNCGLQHKGAATEETTSTSAASDDHTSIESRTKGVSQAPQTHSGPTGPPSTSTAEAQTPGSESGQTKPLETVMEAAQEEQTTTTPTTMMMTTTTTTTTTTPTVTTTADTTSSGNAEQSVSSSSSCSNKATVQRQRRLRTPIWARSMSTNKTTHVKENHGANIFGVAFNTLLGKEEPQVFATAGSNRCTVYECPRKGGLTLLHCYADPDPDEVFYTCAWSYDLKTSAPLLAAAGYRGVIRVIDIEQNEAVGNYIGHGQAINELKFHPHKLQLLLSGSKDHAIRLWNIQTHVCIAIFGGVEGHRDEVLSIDFNMRGDRIVSSGMDHSLKLWCLNTPEFQHKIELSHTFSQEKSTLPFPTITKHFPDFSTRDIHRNYVDCVQWFGNFVLSKSCENAIVCWKPGQLHQSFEQLKPSDSSCTIIAEFEYDECEIWFVRFGFNPWQKVIALGNQQGKVYVWEMDPSDPEGAHMTTLHNVRSVATVRQIAFSRDASVLVYVCDDATVWRWNRRHATAI